MPDIVKAQAAEDWLDWQGLGCANVSHKFDDFLQWVNDHQSLAREVLAIPDTHALLWLQGGARTQFSMLPFNFLSTKADYLAQGVWSELAARDARHFGAVTIAGKWQADRWHWQWSLDADYAFVVDAESIDGISYAHLDWGIPGWACLDATATLGARVLPWSSWDLVFASAQKHLGSAGLTLVVVRSSWLEAANASVPDLWSYPQQVNARSMVNTPATFSWFVHGHMLQWMAAQGGVSALGNRQSQWAERLYACMDEDDFYQNNIPKAFRSPFHVVAHTPNKTLDDLCVTLAEKEGIMGIRGHKKRGGLRFSLYIGQSEQAIDEACAWLRSFRRMYG